MKLSLPKIRRHSLFVKIVGIMALSIGGIALAISLSNVQTAKQTAKVVTQDRGQSDNRLLASIIAGPTKFAKADTLRGILESTIENSQGQTIGALVVGADGGKLVSVGTVAEDAKDELALARQAMASNKSVLSPDGFTIVHPIAYGGDKAVVGALVTVWTPEPVMAMEWKANQRDLVIAAIAFAIAIAIAIYVFSHVLLQPLQRLQEAILGLERREYAAEIPGQARKDEIGEISQSLDDLRKTLAETEKVEREALFKSAAFMGSTAAMMLVDTDFTIRYCNPHLIELMRSHTDFLAKRMPGFDVDTIIGSPIERFHPNSTAIRNRLMHVKDSTYTTIVPFDTARIQLAINRIDDAEGNLAGFVLEWVDVTRDWFNGAMIEAIDNGQIKAEFSAEGELTQANELFCEAMGLGGDSLAGRRLHDLVQPDEDAPEGAAVLLARVRENRPIWAGSAWVPEAARLCWSMARCLR